MFKAWFKGKDVSTKSGEPYFMGGHSRTYMVAPGQPVWMDRDYRQFAREAFVKNVIAHRAVTMVAEAAGSVAIRLFSRPTRMSAPQEIRLHPVLTLLSQPNPSQSQRAFFTSLMHYRLIAGNAYVHAVGPEGAPPQELHILRPDRVTIIAGKGGVPSGYRYTVGETVRTYPVNRVTWHSRILHLKHFHPLNDWYGLSPVESAAYSIDQHNMSGAWNQALLQNGARPSGALVVKPEAAPGGRLSEEQYHRLKNQIDEQFSGPANAGRPLLLEGGLDWKELSLSPKDMDFMESKHSAARDIALAFGVPPQLLGIPGDNTYSNLQEARLALWEQTVLPLVEETLDSLSRWLEIVLGGNFDMRPDISGISALTERNKLLWERVSHANFLTDDEKRAMVGVGKDGKLVL